MKTLKQHNSNRRPFRLLNQRNDRDGITLLFVISMVVLFLLLGTTFVVVANDYFRVARRRSIAASNTIDGVALLDTAFYQLMREVPLEDSSSPLRGHSILGDQYGYGFRATVSLPPVDPGTSPFVDVVVSASPTGNNRISRIRVPNQEINLQNDPTYFDGALNGQVFSMTSGALAGVSTRIISHRLDIPTHILTYRIRRERFEWTNVGPGDTVIINGRDFSGIGSGDATQLQFHTFDLTNPTDRSNPLDETDPNRVLGQSVMIGAASHPLNVNQIGVPAAVDNPTTTLPGNTDFINGSTNLAGVQRTGTGFLALDNSPNEAYDAPDFQNMFLSGFVGNSMSFIPSFHRNSLYLHQETNVGLSVQDIRRYTFRPVFIADAGSIDGVAPGSTANEEFFNSHLSTSLMRDGSLTLSRDTVNLNVTSSLDVDTDGDGVRDSVWIDIGLPTQTTPEGDTFRPLVAYRVNDMDGRLNVNAHGSTVDQASRARGADPIGRGSGFGVAEVSLSGVTMSNASYGALLAQRDDGGVAPIGQRFNDAQKLFGYPLAGNATDAIDGLFSTAANVLGQHSFRSDTNAGDPDEMPGFLPLTAANPIPTAGMPPETPTLTAAELQNPYLKDFSIGGGTGDSLFRPSELEPLLRRFDADSGLISSRLQELINPANFDEITTDSFDIAMPTVAVSLPRRLNDLLRLRNQIDLPNPGFSIVRSNLISSLIPVEILRGGKLDINRPLGNGVDDAPTDGIVDNETVVERTGQRGSPSLPVELFPNQRKHQLARDIYITMLLACGDRAPTGFTVTTPTEIFPPASMNRNNEDATIPLTAADREYRKLIAQYAINIVDYRDPDSIMTPFEFDIEPFDADGFVVDGDIMTTTEEEEGDRVVVWGAERTNLLLTESFASHDRRTRDAGVGMGMVGTMAPDEDDDWDSIDAPFSNAGFEIYNPWLSSSLGLANGIYNQPFELGGGTSIDMGLRSPTGDSPVWRIGLKRVRSELNTDIIRTIYFTDDISSLPATMDATGDRFFPTTAAGAIVPGGFQTIATSASETIGPGTISFGTPVIVDMPRALSISDIDGGYTDGMNPVAGGMPFPTPIDRPVDTVTAHGQEDFPAIWTNGSTDNFRFAYLQRLANPLLEFDVNTNPYRTVDLISVDLLSRNSLSGSPNGNDTAELVIPAPNAPGGGATAGSPLSSDFVLESTQRGELAVATSTRLARRNLFASEDGDTMKTGTATLMAPAANAFSYGARNNAYASTEPYGSLVWNDRPYANVGELLNVPYLSGGLLGYFFNEGAQPATAVDPVYESYRTEIVPFFAELNTGANDQHRHLLRFTAPLGTGGGTINANRFAQFFEFVEVPSRFLGSETYLDAPFPAGFDPPFNYVPNFRTPGRVNINTVTNMMVWEAVENGLLSSSFNLLPSVRNVDGGPVDFPGYYTSSEGRMFVPNVPDVPDLAPAKGSAGTIYQPDGTMPVFDTPMSPGKDPVGTSYFRNELKQRLSSVVTTKSSVFSIWITIGYFNVDEFGRIGSEIGSDEGNVRRNRAFFMVDRSIPVAFEPGRNHNVDQTILQRTIIE